MTAIIADKADKAESIVLLGEILRRFVINGVTHAQREAITEHMRWLDQQPADLNVNCKLETVPELQMTRVVLEYSFLPIPKMETKQ